MSAGLPPGINVEAAARLLAQWTGRDDLAYWRDVVEGRRTPTNAELEAIIAATADNLRAVAAAASPMVPGGDA